jgi:2-oxo-4-hydroxy-4-carboxy-5-ureidoimidazoline decarboxylase
MHAGQAMTLAALNAMDEDAAVQALLRCCGSTRWARRLAASRPFDAEDQLLSAGDDVWWRLEPADWRDAFAAHPAIGSTARAEQAAPASTADWSRQEQAGADGAPTAVLERLAAANLAYRARFGYTFIVCATGRTAADMLADCERRLANDPAAELAVAAEEQRRITRIRLMKLLAS